MLLLACTQSDLGDTVTRNSNTDAWLKALDSEMKERRIAKVDFYFNLFLIYHYETEYWLWKLTTKGKQNAILTVLSVGQGLEKDKSSHISF